MGFTLDDAFIETQNEYKLKLLAGANGCGNAISWVHMIEDTTMIQQFWGKELAVTTGLGFQNHDSLLHFIQLLIKHHSVGVIINVGRYIHEIPQDIIDYCDEQDFPLLTMPWEVHMADLIRDFSIRCLSAEKEDKQISKYFKDVFTNAKLLDESKNKLVEAFDVEGSFQIVLISLEGDDELSFIERKRIASQLEICFEKIRSPYSFFWYDQHFVLVVNNLPEEDLENIVYAMYRRAKKRIAEYPIHIGMSDSVRDFSNVIKVYKRAYAALRMAVQFQYETVFFREMGIYQLLFLIEDQAVLKNMHDELLQPLIQYDQQHHGELENTLYEFLLNDGNQLAMSKKLFMHRNTINYRMTKIKELLCCDLNTFEERLPYMLAFYEKKMF